MEVLYYIWGRHFRVLYKNIEYDMQVEKYNGERFELVYIIAIYQCNGINHMLVKLKNDNSEAKEYEKITNPDSTLQGRL